MKRKLLAISAAVAIVVFSPGVVYAYALAMGAQGSSIQTDAVLALALIGGCIAGILAIASVEAKS